MTSGTLLRQYLHLSTAALLARLLQPGLALQRAGRAPSRRQGGDRESVSSCISSHRAAGTHGTAKTPTTIAASVAAFVRRLKREETCVSIDGHCRYIRGAGGCWPAIQEGQDPVGVSRHPDRMRGETLLDPDIFDLFVPAGSMHRAYAELSSRPSRSTPRNLRDICCQRRSNSRPLGGAKAGHWRERV